MAVVLIAGCGRNNIQEKKEWLSIFKKAGIDSVGFELRDHNHEQLFYLNKDRVSQQLSPASTFKIFLALVALETNIAPDENLVLPWDGITYDRVEWNKDMNMREALKTSSEPYFRELSRRIGAVELQKWLDTVQYGNKRIGDSIDRCWINDSLRISADEQVGFMKKLYFDKLPFTQRTQRIVRSMMLQEDQPGYKLYYKTGTKVKSDGSYLIWLTGFMERKETQKNVVTNLAETNFKPYFFTLNFDSGNKEHLDPSFRVGLLKEILHKENILDSLAHQ